MSEIENKKQEDKIPAPSEAAGSAEVPAPQPPVKEKPKGILTDEQVQKLKGEELAKIAARNEKKSQQEKAAAMQEAVRFEQLRAIPAKLRSKEEARELNRLNQKQRRAAEKGEAVGLTNQVETREQYWDINRSTLSKPKMEILQERESRVEDILNWMKYGHEIDPSDELYVPLKEGIADIIADIKEFGVLRTMGMFYDQSISPFWDSEDGVHIPFYKDTVLLKKLLEESTPQNIYCKYGFCTAIPDSDLRDFLVYRCKWSFDDFMRLVGMKQNMEGRISYS